VSARVARYETASAPWIERSLCWGLGVALGLLPFALIGIAVFALASVLNHREVDPAIPPTYSTAVSEMQGLPGISCPSETQYRFSQLCAWGGWRMEMSMGIASVRQVCRNRDEHVVFGGSDWSLVLKPAAPSASQVLALSPDEAAQLHEAFALGNGVNWQAC
jgi:hypothetical protein